MFPTSNNYVGQQCAFLLYESYCIFLPLSFLNFSTVYFNHFHCTHDFKQLQLLCKTNIQQLIMFTLSGLIVLKETLFLFGLLLSKSFKDMCMYICIF